MADRLDRLRSALAELQAELSAGSLDPTTREELAAAASEIAAALRRGQRSQETQQAQTSLEGRLVDFEASHPQLAMIIGRLLDGLAQLGI